MRILKRSFFNKINIITRFISNFTDFSVFELIDGVSLRYVTDKKELGDPDLILLPGTKNTMGDMEWLIESGLEGAIIRAARTTRVIGICGGFQLLGKEMHDPDGVEHGGDMRGLGLLDTDTSVCRDNSFCSCGCHLSNIFQSLTAFGQIKKARMTS